MQIPSARLFNVHLEVNETSPSLLLNSFLYENNIMMFWQPSCVPALDSRIEMTC